jgi:hypothetical protein
MKRRSHQNPCTVLAAKQCYQPFYGSDVEPLVSDV